MPNISKLDQRIIALQKAICGLSKSNPNITTKLPHDQFGLNAQSLKTEYLTCIGKQLRNVLNDPGRLGIIYKGFTNHILAKYGGSQHLPRLNKESCLHFPTARTLYLLKHNGLAHIQTDHTTFLHIDTPPAKIWLQKTINYPNITASLSRKYLYQLLLLNITTLEQITLPNRTTIMNEKEFHQYHKKSTPTIKKALKIASHLICTSTCTDTCRPPCNIHQQSYIQLPDITNWPNQNFYHNPPLENNPLSSYKSYQNPLKECKNYKITPSPFLQTKNNTKEKTNLTPLKCSHHINVRIQPENQNYTMWMTTNKVFLHNKPNIANHNLILIKQFYLTQQYIHYSNIIEKNFYHPQ
jgi:hypothetical protein